MMKIFRGVVLWLLLTALCLGLAGCGGTRSTGYEVIARLDSEQFSVAFRYGDSICTIVTAAMEVLAADGLFSRLSSQYLGADYSCLEGNASALSTLTVPIPAGKKLLVGVEGGDAPLCWLDDSGSYTGLIPDLITAVADKLGWEIQYVGIGSEDVAVELASGNVDCAWLPASYSADSTDYSLSPGWMENSHLLVVRKGSGLNRVRSLRGHNIGVTDSTALLALQNNTKIYDTVTVWRYDDIRSSFTALAAGDCDAVVIDSIISSSYLT